MLQQWNLRSRGHHCAVTERPFEEGEKHFTAIYLDSKTGEYTRRDVSADAWAQEQSERKPFSFWKSVYSKNAVDQKPEFAPKESALTLLQRLAEEDNPYTENARYILAAMLERKRILAPTDRKHTEQGIIQFYENRKTGDVYMIRDPELRLDEVAGVQDEVATLLGFGGPAADAAKAVGMKITPEGKVEPAGTEEKKDEAAATVAENAPVESQTGEGEAPATEAGEPEVAEVDSEVSEEVEAADTVVEEEVTEVLEGEGEEIGDDEVESVVAEEASEEESVAEEDDFEEESELEVAEEEPEVVAVTEIAAEEVLVEEVAVVEEATVEDKEAVEEEEVLKPEPEDEGESVMEPEYDESEDERK